MSAAKLGVKSGRARTYSLVALVLVTALPAAAQETPGRELEIDFPELLIGTAESDDGPTGTTVFYFPKGVVAAADVRGGSPGTVNVPAVGLGYEIPYIDAVVFSGGSWYGLSAATGVADAIKARKRAEGEDHIAGVLGAIIYDVGSRRFSRVTPDAALGAAALQGAEAGRFPLGARGAGRMAMQGYYFVQRGEGTDDLVSWSHSGQGGAFRQVGPTKIAVFTVVNAMGSVVDRQGHVVRCHRNDPSAACPGIAERLAAAIASRTEAKRTSGGPTGNTTLTLVVTNQQLSFADLQRLAVQVHSSMARAIQPFATEDDGDVLYAVTTRQVENPDLPSIDLGVVASELAWDAVLSSVPELPPMPVEVEVEEASAAHRFVGTYVFPDRSRLAVSRASDALWATWTRGLNRSSLYFDEGRSYRLQPAEGGVFVIDASARDVLRFETGPEGVTGLTVNPGRWGIEAGRSP